MIRQFVPLDHKVHDRQRFDCGNKALNAYLQKTARQSREKGFASVFIAEHQDDHSRIVAYYCLSMCNIDLGELPEEARKALPRHPVPAALLSRLAVDKEFQGQKIGAMVLTHALKKCHQAAQEVAAFAVVVDAKPEAVDFYTKHGFVPLLDDASRLFLPMETVARL